jgi:hypothetical protein
MTVMTPEGLGFTLLADLHEHHLEGKGATTMSLQSPDARRAVDRPSRVLFSVEDAPILEDTQILDPEVRFLERVIGDMTYARAAAAGALYMCLGMLIGLIVALFATGYAWLGVILGGLLVGVGAGAAFGLYAHWATCRRRQLRASARHG